MIFSRLADVVIRRYKLIIAAWIILLLIALPIAPRVGEVLVYEETEMASSQLDSQVATEFISREFGDVLSRGTTIVVLTSPDVLDNETKRTIYSLQKEFFNASHDGRIEGNLSSESLYSVLVDFSAGLMRGMSQGISEGKDKVDLTADLLFGVPSEFRELYWLANGTSFTIYGMPDTHIELWNAVQQANPNWTIAQVDNSSYFATIMTLRSHPIMEGMTPTMQSIAWRWFSAYAQAWNATASNITLTPDPVLRRDMVIQTALPPFVSSLPAEYNEFFSSVAEGFDIGTYGEHHLLNRFCARLFDQQLDPSAYPYFNQFYSIWNSTDWAPDELEYREEVSTAVGLYAESLGGEEGQLVMAVFHGLGFDRWNDTEARTALVVRWVGEVSECEEWVVWEVEKLGDSPSFAQVYGLAERVVRDQQVMEFPMPVPTALISNMVNTPYNDTTVILITFESPSLASESIDVVRGLVHSSVPTSSIVAYVTGEDAIASDLSDSFDEDMGLIDPVAIVLILLLIGIFFRSIVASSIPPLSIGVAIGVAMAAVYLIGSHLTSIHYSVLAIMITAMLGAGCDYCIFILSRYREERLNGLGKEESVRTAVEWAGEAVTTSGMTVMIGFGVLALGRFSLLQSMGISLALGILIALMVSLTLLPSLICLLGDRLFWPNRLQLRPPPVKTRDVGVKGMGYFGRSARSAVRHAKVIVLVAIIVSVPATYLVLTLDTSYDYIAGMPETESKKGVQVLGEGFGQGRIDPTYFALNFTSRVLDEGAFDMESLDIVEEISADLSSLPFIKEVISPTRPLGEPIDYRDLSGYPIILVSEYQSIMEGMIGSNRSSVLIQVIFEMDPFSKESIDTVTAIRSVGENATSLYPTVQATYVAGGTAAMFDITQMVEDDFKNMIILAILGIYIVLLVVLGSVLIPLRLILTILLSISWTIALTMLVFIHLVGTPILWMMPMVLFVVCMGLGMDYDILLTTRIREEVSRGSTDREAIVTAVEKTGKVITICGLIMAGTFATMMLSSTALLQQFGFALSFAILLDATVVRIYLVPAIMVLLEGYNWWAPGRLQRVRREEKTRTKGKG